MAPEKELRKAAIKLAKKFPADCRIQLLPSKGGFLLIASGEGQFVPTIGVQEDQLIGAQDDFDHFLDLLGYEAQVERVLFDPMLQRYALQRGWAGKFWKTEQKAENFTVDAIASPVNSKVGAMAVCLISAVMRETSLLSRGKRALHRLVSKKSP